MAITRADTAPFSDYLYPNLDSPVIPQVILSPERLAADITGIGPLVRVCPLVDEQIVRLGELSIAELADELFFGPRCPTRST